MKTPLEIYEAIDTEFCMGSPNSLVNRKCKTGKDVIVYAMNEYAKQYHKTQLKLLGIGDVSVPFCKCNCPGSESDCSNER